MPFYLRPLAWAEERKWWWRLPLLAWFVVMFLENQSNKEFALSRLSNPFSALDMGIHELGHMFFSPFGEFMHILGGSLFQCLFPMLWLFGFLQKKWYFAASLCWCWLGLNLYDVAAYAADARARLLPLSGGPATLFTDPTDTSVYDSGHDWYQLLLRTNRLDQDFAIAHGLRIAATVCFMIGFVLAGILLVQMIRGTVGRQPKISAKG